MPLSAPSETLENARKMRMQEKRKEIATSQCNTFM